MFDGCGRAVDFPRPKEDVVRMLLQAFPFASRVRDTNSNLPLNIALEHGSVKSVEVVKMLVDSNPESVKHLNAQGRTPLHSVLYSQRPDMGVARYLARQYPPAITMETKEGKYFFMCK